ncbi:transglycosylase, partial [Mesorhizobium sp. M2D.F.Ca.ET.145.01.1.1]
MSLSPLLVERSFGDLPGWAGDDHLPAFEAFARSALHVPIKPYRSGALGVDLGAFGQIGR